MLKDFEGKPYPDAVQILWEQIRSVTHPDDHYDFQEYLRDALESIPDFYPAV